MVQLEGSGGGGGGLDEGGDGLDGSDTQNEIEDDTSSIRTRRLRRDARSDPLAEPTEPEPEDVAPSPSGTTATVDGGDQPQPDADPMPDPDGGESGPDPSDIDQPDRTTDDATKPDDTGPSPSDADRFGDELGGDPAGDADRTAAPGPTPADIDQPADTGGPTRTGPSPIGGDPAGGADRTPGPTPDDVFEPGTDTPEQGIEEAGATESVEQQAAEFEQQVLAENPWLSEEDVAIQLVGTEEGVRFSVELTEGAEDRAGARRQDILEGLGVGPGSLAATGGTDPAADAQADARAEILDTLEGVGFFDEQAEQRQELREAVEEDIEGQVGAARTGRAGIVNPTLRENVVEGVDLEEGEDFTLDITQTPGGDIQIDAELTESFERAEAEQALERELENQFGIDVEPGEDFEVVLTEDGSFEPELTESGRGRVQLSTLDRTVQDVERGDIPIVTDLTGVRGPRFNIPGQGAIVPEATDTSILSPSPVEGERLLDDFDIPTAIQLAGDPAAPVRQMVAVRLGVRDEGEGPYTLAELGEDFSEAVRGGLEVLESNLTEREAELRRSDVEITGGYGTGQPNPLREAVFAGIGDFAGMVGQSIGLPTRVSQFLAAGIEAKQEGQVDEFTGAAATAGARLPATFASGQVRRFREEPVAAAGGLVGTLVGSLLVMRAIPMSRFLIQPGEELAGIAGFRATRAVAGERTAQRLFPDQEPIFMSEEFALRTARRLGGGTRRAAGRVESGVGRVTGRTEQGSGRMGEILSQAPSIRLETDPEAGFIELDPMARAQLREAARRPGEAIRSGLGAVRRTPGRVRTGTVETGRNVLDRSRQALVRGREELTRITFENARTARRRRRFAVEELALNVENADLDLSVPDIGYRDLVPESARTARRRSRFAVEELALNVESADLNLRVPEVGYRDFVPESARTARRRRRFATQELALAAEGTDIGDILSPEFGYRDLVPESAREARRTRRQGVEDLALTAERFEGIDYDAFTSAPSRLRAAPREGVAGFQVGRGAAGLSDIPGFEAFPGQIQTGPVFRTGFGTGETVSDIGDLFGRSRSRLSDATETLGSLPDLTLRVEPGIPTRPVVSDITFESEARADDPDPLGLFDIDRTETDTEAGESPLDPSRTGVGDDPLLLSVESELESPMETGELEATDTLAGRGRLESAGQGGLVGDVLTGEDLGIDTRAATASDLLQEVAGRDLERGRVDLLQELGMEQEPRVGQEVELGIEPRFGVDTRLDLEVRSEAEAEGEFEFESESELELEPFGGRRRPDDDPDLLASFTGRRRLVERSLLNPLTGN